MDLAPVEQAVVTYLSPAGFHVGTRVPNPRPDQFVKVTRTGGSAPNVTISEPTLLVECWGRTDAQAWAVAAAVWSLCTVPHAVQLSATVWASRVEATEPVNFPDSTSGASRYQFIVTPRIRLGVSA